MFDSFIKLFIANAAQNPNKEAIIFQGRTITYETLHQRSDGVARYILNSRVNPEAIIPLILERHPEIIIAILGILKAGCSFLPISPMTPCARIKYILEDTKANLVISNIEIASILGTKIILVNPSTITALEPFAPPNIMPHHLAYVMYTSGSTGNPKGVLIEHASMSNLFSSLISKLKITKHDRFLALTDYTFDISLIELIMPLQCGSTIVLTEQGTVADGSKIKQYLVKGDISLMQATPLSWKVLLKQGWKNDGNMKILVGGEKFTTKLAEDLDYAKGNVWNMYGPTETTMWSMANNIKRTLTTESVSLGKPLDKTIVEIFDENMNHVAPNKRGELYIGGMGLARGYLNNMELTHEKFITHPKTQQRFYKTGDLVVADNIGNICYVGRIDNQLKYGGIRIEAGEIESAIEQEPLIKSAVVKTHETEAFYKCLAAYIEIDEEKLFSDDVHVIGSDTSNCLKKIYDETYLDAESYEGGVINNCGWQSSFTGKLITIEELDESYQFIREIINTSDLSEVAEIGCGTGSLLLEYIDRAKQCTVIEISSTAIDYVKHKLTEAQQQKVTFRHETAQTMHEHQKYSCIIINSVIQYLPSIHTLITTLKQLVSATRTDGTIIIGDVRALELQDVYLLEKLRTNCIDDQNLESQLNAFYYKSRDTEIVLSPKFFYALKKLIPGISFVDIAVKHGSYKNELNYFRYDVILHINKHISYRPLLTFQFTDLLNERALESIVKSNSKNSILIQGIPYSYIQDILNILNKEIPNHPLSNTAPKIHLNNEIRRNMMLILNFETETHEKFISYDEADPINALQLHLYPKSKEPVRHSDTHEYHDYRVYCREPFNPWLQKFCFDHIKLKIKQHILSWVNPSVYVWIEKWPLTINGKIDRKKLQLPINEALDPLEKSTLKQLQNLWRNVTGDNALVNKEFWIHGVSSLSMYFFLATINETFLLNINYHEFHHYNTLEKLSNYIDELLES